MLSLQFIKSFNRKPLLKDVSTEGEGKWYDFAEFDTRLKQGPKYCFVKRGSLFSSFHTF